MLVRVLLRPISALNVRVINEFIRRRRIQLLRRRTTRDRTAAFTPERRLRKLFNQEAAWHVRHAFRFTIRVPDIDNVGSVLRLALANGGNVRFIFILVVFKGTRLRISFLVFPWNVGGKLGSLRCSFLSNLYIVRLELLERVPRAVAQ